MIISLKRLIRGLLLCVVTALLWAGPQQAASDIPKVFVRPDTDSDYVRREVMIPMRDGVKLYTVVIVPKGARNAPILLTRTPYNASNRTKRNDSPHMIATLPLSDESLLPTVIFACFRMCVESTSPKGIT